jgi:hypothetical protein
VLERINGLTGGGPAEGDASDMAAQLVLRSIEREMFKRAAEGFHTSAKQLDLAEVGALEQVVDKYCSVVQQYLK